MRYVVDRLEGGVAVCEDGDKAFVAIRTDKLPKGVKSGDIVVSHDGIFTIDNAAADERRAEIAALQNKLWG